MPFSNKVNIWKNVNSKRRDQGSRNSEAYHKARILWVMRLFEGEVLLWGRIGKEPWKWGPDVLGSIFPLGPVRSWSLFLVAMEDRAAERTRGESFLRIWTISPGYCTWLGRTCYPTILHLTVHQIDPMKVDMLRHKAKVGICLSATNLRGVRIRVRRPGSTMPQQVLAEERIRPKKTLYDVRKARLGSCLKQ
jgi:hypothetical protein